MKFAIIRYIFILLFIHYINNIYSQYEFDWARTYGGDAVDEALSVSETAEGNLFVCGYTKSSEKHIWLIKIGDQGKPKWGKTYKTMPASEARDMLITSDSSIILTGYCVKPLEYTSDLWLLKLNKYGEKLWYKSYGGKQDEKANAIAATSDGGYAIAGMTKTTYNFDEDAWIIKVDSSGKKLWEKQFGGSKTDYANDIIETKDRNLITCGMTSSQGEGYKSIWLIKMDKDGNEIWNNTYELNKWNVATSLVQGSDSSIYVSAYTRTFSLIDYDAVLLKINTDGELIWKKVFSWGRWDQATSINTTYDDGIVVSGFSRSGKELSSDFAISKFDTDGNLLWQNVFSRKSLDYSNKIIETYDNGLLIVGKSYMQGHGWDFALLKYKNNDQPTINFKQDSVSTSITEIYNLKMCISTKSNLKNIQLFFNDSLYHDNIPKPEVLIENSDCNIPLNFDLGLEQGENIVEVIITDYKNHKIKKTCKIYFFPSTEENW